MMKELGMYIQTVKLVSDSLGIEIDEAVECVNVLGAIVGAIYEEEDDIDEDEVAAAIQENCSSPEIAKCVFALLDADATMCVEMGKVAIDLLNEVENFDEIATMVMNYLR